MKIAVTQYSPRFKDPKGNLETALSMVRQAAEAGAKLIVLPEMCLTGYSFMSYAEALPFAEHVEMYPDWYSRSNPPTSMMAMERLVNQYRIAVAWGLITISQVNEGNRLHNSQVLMYPGGFKLVHKLNFFGNDFLWATEGTESPPIVNWMGRKIGMLICADVRDKSDRIDDFYEPGDADIVAFSTNFGAGAFPSRSWIRFAKENKTWLISSNRYGQEQNNDFGHGGIGVISPEGKVSCEGLVWDQPCIVYADIP